MTRISIAAALACLGIGIPGPSGSEFSQDELMRFPTYGVAFKAPRRWPEAMRDKPKTIVQWISPDSVPKKPAALIMVECGHTPKESLDEVARGLAKNFGGTVSDRPTTLGGTRAMRIAATSDGPMLHPVEALATVHDGLLYLVMGGVTAGHSVAEELEVIRASWTWMPIEPIDKHLEFRGEPLSLGGGAATMNVPALMHTYPTEHPDRVLALGLHNVRRDEPEFLMYAQLEATVKGQKFDEIKNGLTTSLRLRFKVKGSIKWGGRANDPTRAVTEPFEVETPEAAGGRKRWNLMRWALVEVDDQRLVSVNFTLPQQEDHGRSTYIALVDRIVDSIQRSAGTGRRTDREKPRGRKSTKIR